MFERWITGDLPDKSQARRARALNALVLSFALGMVLFLLAGLSAWPWTFSVFALGGVMLGSLAVVYVLNRQGRLRTATWVFELSVNGMSLVVLLLLGHRSVAPVLIPIAVLSAGVLMHRRAGATLAVAWAAIYSVVALVELAGWLEPLEIPVQEALLPHLAIIGQLLGIGLIGVLGWQAASCLLGATADARCNLELAQRREDESERARADLSQQVRERTRDLENELVDAQEIMADQRRVLESLREQALPVVPLFRQIIALPVVGMLDAERARQLLSSLLDGIQRYDAHVALLDITGVPIIDEAAAEGLTQAIAGAHIVGAECVLVGVNPEIASRLVDLRLDLSQWTSHVDMEAGLRYALRKMGYQLRG